MTDALTQTTAAAISTADRKLAYKFAERLEAIEKASVEFCMDLAEAVDSRIEGSQNSFLTFACPRIPIKTAKSMVVAGRETARAIAAGRPATFYGWATYEKIAQLPEEHKDWAYEEPRSKREIQAFKKSLKTPTQPTQSTTINDQPTELPVCPPLLSMVPDLEPQLEARLTEVNGVPMGTDQQRSLAEHWHNVEQSDAPDSYKQAQFLLSQLDVLLSGARRDGWSEHHYAALFQDLESYAKSCEAASRDYRGRVEAECEARFAGTISRIDGGVALPC